jgi:hypothetical protein
MDQFKREIYQAIETKFRFFSKEQETLVKKLDESISLKIIENERLDKKQTSIITFLFLSNLLLVLIILSHVFGGKMTDTSSLHNNQVELLQRIIKLEERTYILETELKLSKKKGFLSKFLIETPKPKIIKKD